MRTVIFRATAELRSRGWNWGHLKCPKSSVLTENQPFFFNKCYLDCCKSFVDFQISEKVDSECLCPIFIAFMEGWNLDFLTLTFLLMSVV